MPVSTELQRPETEDHFESMCCVLYQRVYGGPGFMRVGRSGQGQFGVDLLGAELKPGMVRSIGVQCKHYVKTKFTLRTVTDDVEEADRARLDISHLVFATTAPASATIVRQVHELSMQRGKKGLFTISVDFWNTIEAHIQLYPEVGRSFIPGYPGGTLLSVKDDVGAVLDLARDSRASQLNIEALMIEVSERLRLTVGPSAGSLSPEARGDEADPALKVSLDYVRDSLQRGKTKDAAELLASLGDPNAFRDEFSKFRWYTNQAAVDLMEGRNDDAAQGFLRAFEFAPTEEKAHINRVLARIILRDFKAAEEDCKAALLCYGTNGTLWGLQLHIRVGLGKEPESSNVPESAARSSEYLFSLARIRSDQGQPAEASELLKQCLAIDGGSLDGRRSYLANALLWANVSSPAAMLGQLPSIQRETIEDAVLRFEPLEETLASIQGNLLSEEIATNVTSALLVLDKIDRARSVANQLASRHPDLEQVLRIRLIEASEAKDAKRLRDISNGRLDSLPPVCLAVVAEASASFGDIGWHAEVAAVVLERLHEDERLRDLLPLAAFAKWQNGDRVSALREAQAYTDAHPEHIFGRVIAAQMLLWSEAPDQAKKQVRACLPLIPEDEVTNNALQVAGLLAGLDLHAEAARLYERFIAAPAADDLTIKWLHSLVASDQRKKAMLTLQKLSPDDRSHKSIRHIEINLAARMMDWHRMRSLLEMDIAEGNMSADVALGYGAALFRGGDGLALSRFVATDPPLVDARLEQQTEFAKLQIIANEPVLGLNRLLRLFRAQPHNARVASILLAQVLLAKSIEGLQAPEEVGPGCAVRLSGKGDSWTIAIDEVGGTTADSWPELVGAGSPVAAELIGARLGETRLLKRGARLGDAVVTGIVSLLSFAVEKAQQLIASMPEGTGSIWSLRVLDEDGQPDLAVLLDQARRRREQVEAAVSLYRGRDVPIELFAKFIGTNPVELRLDWPSAEVSQFVCVGRQDERDAAAATLQPPGQRCVVDLFTLTDILHHDLEDVLLAVAGRPLIPESVRQQVLGILQALPAGQHVSSMKERDGKLQIVELSLGYRQRRRVFIESLLAFINEHCEVVATAGPEEFPKNLLELVKLLEDSSADCLLLCLERDATFLSQDGVLRSFATQVGISAVCWLQPLMMQAHEQGLITHIRYATYIAAAVRDNQNFVSVTANDLLELAKRTPQKIHPSVRAILRSFRESSLDLASGVRVSADFLKKVTLRLPAPSTAAYATLARASLQHNRSRYAEQIGGILAVSLKVFGRNGRRLPQYVRRMFGGLLSRRWRRRRR